MRLGFVGFNRLELDALLAGLRFQTSHVFHLDTPLPAGVALDAVLLSTAAWHGWAAAPVADMHRPLVNRPWAVLSETGTALLPAQAHGVQPQVVGIGAGAQAPLEVVQRWLNQQVGAKGVRWPQRPVRERSALSHREHQVLALLSQGMSNEDIAVALGIRVPTVKTYLRRIFERTGALNRAHAVALYAERHAARWR